MTSAITPGTINVDYPVPGVNNSTQGFRDNFSATKNNFTTAATEISDLQSKVLLKSPLTGTLLNNDMSNALITNALTGGFRSTTYNLGSNMSGSITVDLTLGDVQYGTLTGNIILTFTKWPPVNTSSHVELILNVTPGQVITLPYGGSSSVAYGTTTIQGYYLTGTTSTITIPAGVTRVHYRFTSIDCGTTIEIIPLDRPRNGLVNRTPSSATDTGTAGQVAYDNTYIYVCIAANTWRRAAISSW